MANETREKADPKNAKDMHKNWTLYCPTTQKTNEKIFNFNPSISFLKNLKLYRPHLWIFFKWNFSQTGGKRVSLTSFKKILMSVQRKHTKGPLVKGLWKVCLARYVNCCVIGHELI